jgi:hypothetical protein
MWHPIGFSSHCPPDLGDPARLGHNKRTQSTLARACMQAVPFSSTVAMATITGAAGVLLGPLTTTWSAPSYCNYWMWPCATCDVAYQAQTCLPVGDEGPDQGGVGDAQGCWPPTNTKVLIQKPTQPFAGWGFYSPGLACPTGYRSACAAVYGERPEWPIQFTLNEGETAVGCCPECDRPTCWPRSCSPC